MTLTLIHTQSIPVITPPEVVEQATQEARVAAALRRRRAQPVPATEHIGYEPDLPALQWAHYRTVDVVLALASAATLLGGLISVIMVAAR